MTGRELITASLRLIGAIAPGESISASEATDGLASINRMIDSWSNDSLIIYSNAKDEFSLTAGVQEYTMGPSGTFNTVRPLKIQEVNLKVDVNNPAVEYPLRILSLNEWANIRQKEMTSTIPTDFYSEGTYPLETLHIFPKPTAAYKIVIYSLKQISNISTLDTVISFPPGYERALVYNGAIELCAEYGRQPNEIIFNIANESKAAIKRTNSKPNYLRVDAALMGNGHYNIYTGETR